MASATIQGTEKYFASHPHFKAKKLGFTELSVSPFGFGTYRITDAEPLHREALKLALTSGVNLIDTSSNYGDDSGSAEKMIGQTLAELFEAQSLSRHEVVLVSKIGYVQGRTLREAKLKIDNRQPWPEMVDYQENCWHNISPEFLGDQLDHCLANLRIDCLDVLLLHNPEYYLKTAKQKDVYYARIKKAFEFLETQVELGRIKYYGISSNTFIESESSFESTSLEKCFQIAKDIKKNNHFAVIEFPLNLYEHQAATLKNNAQKTILEFASANKLGTLSNRPLNALLRGQMNRLVSYPNYDSVEVKGDMHRILGRVIELEKKNVAHNKTQGLMWGHALRENLQQLDDIVSWREVLYRQILPSLDSALNRLPSSVEAWAKEYRTITLELLALITKNLEGIASQRSQIIFDQIAVRIPQFKKASSFSSQMLQLYSSLSISCVLVGMRTPEYVADCLKSVGQADENLVVDTLYNFSKK
jgi:aryl-alcohol dehydrogenase-like predicted oxidoreductase